MVSPPFHLDVNSRPLLLSSEPVSLLHLSWLELVTRGAPGGRWAVSNPGTLPGAWHSVLRTPLGRLGIG